MKKILLVEDDELIYSVISRAIVDGGFEVVGAHDGDSVVPLATENKPDLILLDVILPGKSGFEILEALKADPALKAIPVMMLSNLGQPADVKRAKDAGAIDYMVKANFEPRDVVAKVHGLLGDATPKA